MESTDEKAGQLLDECLNRRVQKATNERRARTPGLLLFNTTNT
jgi:hypothetical protein